MQEGQEPCVGLAFNADVVEPVAARQGVAVEEGAGASSARAQQLGAALAKEYAVVQLVDRVCEIQPPEQGIGRHFRGPEDVAAAVGFHLGECEELAYAPPPIAPHPAMHRAEHSIDPRGSSRGRHSGGSALLYLP